MHPLTPDTPVCGACLGQGYERRFCRTCALSYSAAHHFDHLKHDSIGNPRSCPHCGGSGKLVDQLRKRVLRAVQPNAAGNFRDFTKIGLAEWMQAAMDRLTIESLFNVCSSSPADTSTSSPLIMKRPGGRTTP